jgi:molybdenum cofactor cytidylyltransferase
MSIAVIILAAGEAKRFGSAKLVTPIDGVPLVRRAVLAALNVCAHVVVVTGAHRAAVEASIADLPIERVFNAEWAEGLGGSIARGVAQLPPALEAAIILLADQPLIGAQELRQLIEAHAAAPEHIIAAQFSSALGPPCLFPLAYFSELVGLRGDEGARSLLRRYVQLVEALPMPAAAVDIDTPQDLSPFTSGA